MVYKGLLYGVEPALLIQPLDRQDLLPMRLDG
jgi:hypothetical protein